MKLQENATYTVEINIYLYFLLLQLALKWLVLMTQGIVETRVLQNQTLLRPSDWLLDWNTCWGGLHLFLHTQPYWLLSPAAGVKGTMGEHWWGELNRIGMDLAKTLSLCPVWVRWQCLSLLPASGYLAKCYFSHTTCSKYGHCYSWIVSLFTGCR